MNMVRITPKVGSASGKREGWVRIVEDVDPKGTDGYAVTGPFLTPGKKTEVEEGSVLLHVDPAGSVKNWWKVARVTRLQADGEELELLGATYWNADFLDVRDALVSALSTEAATDPRDELVDAVASLNPDAGEIGPGMLADIIAKARSIQEGRNNGQ